MSGLLRSRLITASLVLVLSIGASTASAQVARFVGPALAMAPANTAPADLRLDILNVLPHDTLGFVTAHHVLDTKKTVENVLRKLNVPFDAGDDYAEFEAFLNGLKGWDDAGTHAIALFPVAGKLEPEVAVFVPVKNYKQFAASVGAANAGDAPLEFKIKDGPDGWIAAKENYAVLTEAGDDGRALLDTILTSKKSLTESRGPLRKWIGEYQFAAVVTRGGTDKIIDAILDGLKEAKENFKNLGDEELAASAGQVVAVFDVYESILKSLRDDITHLAFGSHLSETAGLRLAGEALFAPNGKFTAAVKDFAPLPADALKSLPDERYFLAGAATTPTELSEALMNLSFGMYKNVPAKQGGAALTPEQIAKMTQVSKDMMQGVKSFAMSLDAAGEGIFGGAVVLYRVEDSAAFLKRYEASIATMQELAKQADSPLLPKQTLEHLKIDDLDVLSLTVDISKQFDQLGAGGPVDVKKIMQAMFGGNGTVTGYATAAGKETVVIAYDRKVLKQTVAAIAADKSGLADNANLKKTAAMFPQGLHAVGYLNVAGAVDFGRKVANMVMAAQGQGGFPIPIPPFPETAPLGYAARVNGPALEGHFVVPMELMEGVRDYVQNVAQMFGGGLR